MHLRPGFCLGIFLLLAPCVLHAQDDRQMDQYLLDRMVSNRGQSKVNVDAKRVINESSSFLKEREPEMTGEEYALYEKVVTMLGTNPAFAVKLLEAMMNEKEPPSPAFEFILGNAYYSAGDVDKAAASYQSAVKHYPTFVRAWNNLGVLYYAAGKYEEATPCFSRSITLGDKDPMTFGLLGSCLERDQDYVSAELAYMQALAGDPSSSEWKEGLLRICIQQRQDARAEALVKKLIKDRPDEKRYWLVYANLKLTEGKKLEAITLLETAAGTGIAGPDELTMLGDLYAEEHLTPEALRIYQKLLAASPDAGEHRLLAYARMLTSAGKYAEAKETLDRLEPKVSPANQAALQQARGEWLVAQEKWPEARALFEKILQQAPFNGPALLGIGRSYAAENDLAHAQLSFEAAFKVPESKYAACLELANVELRNRNYRRSVDYLQQALSIERTDAVEDYLARIKSLVSD